MKRLLAFGLALAAGLLSLAPATVAEAQPTFTMNFGTVAPDNTPWSRQLNDTKARIERDSQGAIKVKVFLGGALGSEVEMVRDIRRGERLQGGGISTAAVADGAGVALLQLPELPYLFRTDAEADTVMDEVLFDPSQKELQAKGFVLGFWALNGWRSFATKGGPASSPAELARFKMRSQESPVHQSMYRALGAQAVAKPTSEVLPAINTGIVDGFDNTTLFGLAAGWMEPMTHYTLSRHIYQPAAVLYSKKFFDTLPAGLQQVVMGDPRAEAVRGRAEVRKLEGELMQTVKEMGIAVVELTPEQRAAFATATQPVHTEFLTTNPALKPIYDAVQKRLASMR